MADTLIEPALAEAASLAASFEAVDEPFRRRRPAAWSVGENIEHLRLSVRPINLALALPRIGLRLFGRASTRRSYEEVVEAYRGRLAHGARASAPFVPTPSLRRGNPPDPIPSFIEAYDTYADRLARVEEYHLDSLRLPHPILGLLSLREMAFFTLYHLRHHHEAIRREAERP